MLLSLARKTCQKPVDGFCAGKSCHICGHRSIIGKAISNALLDDLLAQLVAFHLR
jgi:hypothetical protein